MKLQQLTKLPLPIALAGGLAFAFPAAMAQDKSAPSAQSDQSPSAKGGKAATKALNQSDRSIVSITGDVKSVTPQSFVLDYGKGEVTVEMDGWKSDGEHQVTKGHKVTVYGRIDNDLFQAKRIEASMVFDHSANTYHYANSADEEIGFAVAPFAVVAVVDVSTLGVTGTIADVNGREFTLDTGSSSIKVDTGSMAYNPMDDEGAHKLAKGDRVVVYGRLDDAEFFEKREIQATSVISLREDEGEASEAADAGNGADKTGKPESTDGKK